MANGRRKKPTRQYPKPEIFMSTVENTCVVFCALYKILRCGVFVLHSWQILI